MANAKSVKVDKSRFYDSLSRRGLSCVQVSQEMGYAKSTLGMAVKAGRFTMSQAVMLEKLYDIKPDEYEVKKVSEEEPVKAEPKFDMNELYKTIYTAVFNATKEAFNA